MLFTRKPLGAAARVRMSPGLLTDYALYRDKSWPHLREMQHNEGGWPVEVAIIDVENRGRAAVTVTTPSLALRSTRR